MAEKIVLQEGASFTCKNCGYKYELSAKTIGPTSEKTPVQEPEEPEKPELPAPDEVSQPSPETEVSPPFPKESRFAKAVKSLLG